MRIIGVQGRVSPFLIAVVPPAPALTRPRHRPAGCAAGDHPREPLPGNARAQHGNKKGQTSRARRGHLHEMGHRECVRPRQLWNHGRAGSHGRVHRRLIFRAPSSGRCFKGATERWNPALKTGISKLEAIYEVHDLNGEPCLHRARPGRYKTGQRGRRCWTASSWPDGELVRGCMWNSRRTRPRPPGRVARTLAHQRTVIVSWGRSTLSGRLRSNTAPPRCRRPQRCGIAADAACSDRTLHYSDQGRRPWRSLRGARLTLSVLLMLRYEAEKSWQFSRSSLLGERERRLISPTRVRAACLDFVQ